MFNPSTIAVILAAYNEEEGISPTITEMKQALKKPHIIVVDGKSNDRTVELAKALGAKVIVQEGKGKGDALIQGLSALSSEITCVVFIDADFTYPATH